MCPNLEGHRSEKVIPAEKSNVGELTDTYAVLARHIDSLSENIRGTVKITKELTTDSRASMSIEELRRLAEQQKALIAAMDRLAGNRDGLVDAFGATHLLVQPDMGAKLSS